MQLAALMVVLDKVLFVSRFACYLKLKLFNGYMLVYYVVSLTKKDAEATRHLFISGTSALRICRAA